MVAGRDIKKLSMMTPNPALHNQSVEILQLALDAGEMLLTWRVFQDTQEALMQFFPQDPLFIVGRYFMLGRCLYEPARKALNSEPHCNVYMDTRPWYSLFISGGHVLCKVLGVESNEAEIYSAWQKRLVSSSARVKEELDHLQCGDIKFTAAKTGKAVSLYPPDAFDAFGRYAHHVIDDHRSMLRYWSWYDHICDYVPRLIAPLSTHEQTEKILATVNNNPTMTWMERLHSDSGFWYKYSPIACLVGLIRSQHLLNKKLEKGLKKSERELVARLRSEELALPSQIPEACGFLLEYFVTEVVGGVLPRIPETSPLWTVEQGQTYAVTK